MTLACSNLVRLLAIALGSFTLCCLLLVSKLSAQDLPVVVLHEVAAQDVREQLEFPTRLRAVEATRIVPRVSGPLKEKLFESGSRVEKGQVLFEISPLNYRLAADQRLAELEQARAALEIAEKTFSRAEVLTDRNALSRQRMDEIQSDYVAALNKVASAELELERANLFLGFTKITAPVDGVITNEPGLSVGDMVGPETGALGTLDLIDPIRAWIHVDEKLDEEYARRILAGETLEFEIRLRLASDTEYAEQGSVVAFDNTVDPSTGTRAMQIEFANSDYLLTPGMAGTVVVEEVTDTPSVAIPQVAVLQDQRGLYVFAVDDGNTVEKKYPAFGAQVGEWWIVNSGLEPGDLIAVSNLQRIAEGIEVSPSVD